VGDQEQPSLPVNPQTISGFCTDPNNCIMVRQKSGEISSPTSSSAEGPLHTDELDQQVSQRFGGFLLGWH